MFIDLPSLNWWLSICSLNHDALVFVKGSKQVKTFFGATLCIKLLSSLKLFKDLLRAFKVINVHMSLLNDNFAILSVLLLIKAEANWKIKLRSWHLHSHHLRLHVLVLTLHVLRHASRSHHHSLIVTCSSCHHHILARATHSHRHPSSHHHLIVRVPHSCGHLMLGLLNNINRHSKETELTTKSRSLVLRLRRRGHHWWTL